MENLRLRSPLEDEQDRGVSMAWIARAVGTSNTNIHRLRAQDPDGAGRMSSSLFLALRDLAGVDFTEFIQQSKRFKSQK